jgi:hypothetical protein
MPKKLGLPKNSGLSKRFERPRKPGLPERPGRPGKPGESSNSGGHFATWFISSWRSDGAFRNETLPRVKVGAGAARTTEILRDGQDPGAPQVQDGGRDADGDVATARRTLPHTCKPGSDQTVQGITRHRNKPRDRDNSPSPVTSPEQHDHEANRLPPQADRSGLP